MKFFFLQKTCANMITYVYQTCFLMNFNAFYSFQVRLGKVTENGRVVTKRLGEHDGRVHKLAVEPGSPHIFYSCGEDGLVQHVS